MQAMLLAAGLGTRLRPLTDRMPKCMVPLAGKPILERNIEWLKAFEVREFVINLHYLPDVVRGYFGDGAEWDVHITYSFEPDMMGTAGAVKLAASHFTEPFIVWYADNLSTCNLAQLVQQHQSRHALATIALFYRDDVTQSGIVGLDDDDRVRRFLEKPRLAEIFSHWVNAGIYVLDPAVISYIAPTGSSDFGRDVFPALLAAHQPVYGYRMGQSERLWWIDTSQDLERVQREISKEER